MAYFNDKKVLAVVKTEYLNVTDEELAFLKSEYEKTLNVWDEVWESGYYDVGGSPVSGTNVRSKSTNPIKVSPNASIFLGYSGTSSNVAFNITCFDANGVFISQLGWTNANRSITIPANCHYIKFFMNGAYGATYNHDITISEGDHASPYHPYNGKIMHEIDCQGVELWENGNHYQPFNASTITISDSSEFRRLRFIVKLNNSVTQAQASLFFDNIISSNNNKGVLSLTDYLGGIHVREFTILSSTSIQFSNGKVVGGEETPYAIIPVAIYGIK